MTGIRQQIGQPPQLADGSVIPLSPGIAAGDLVFISGQLGLDVEGRLVGPDIVSQTERALANIAAILELAKLDMSNVVKITGWLADRADFVEFNRVYARHFPQLPPARSMVVSELLIPGAKVELEAIASARVTPITSPSQA